jgi:hypothetical protein
VPALGQDFAALRPPVEREMTESMWDLVAAMREVAPQAILRDLHRPVTMFTISEYERVDIGWDRGGRRSVAGIREALRADYRVPITGLLRGPADLRESIAERRAALDYPWQDVPKLGVEATTSEAMPVFAPSIAEEMASWK